MGASEEQILDNTYLKRQPWQPILGSDLPGVDRRPIAMNGIRADSCIPRFRRWSWEWAARALTSTPSYFDPPYSWDGESRLVRRRAAASSNPEYAEPAYQESVQSTGARTVPDVSSDANPNTGLAVFDPFDFGSATPWDAIGGTSLSSPTVAGLVAIADQGLASAGEGTLGGPSQTLPGAHMYTALNAGGTNVCSTGEQYRWEQLTITQHHGGL